MDAICFVEKKIKENEDSLPGGISSSSLGVPDLAEPGFAFHQMQKMIDAIKNKTRQDLTKMRF